MIIEECFTRSYVQIRDHLSSSLKLNISKLDDLFLSSGEKKKVDEVVSTMKN